MSSVTALDYIDHIISRLELDSKNVDLMDLKRRNLEIKSRPKLLRHTFLELSFATELRVPSKFRNDSERTLSRTRSL